jgi:hypothetical protein
MTTNWHMYEYYSIRQIVCDIQSNLVVSNSNRPPENTRVMSICFKFELPFVVGGWVCHPTFTQYSYSGAKQSLLFFLYIVGKSRRQYSFYTDSIVFCLAQSFAFETNFNFNTIDAVRPLKTILCHVLTI